MTLSAAANRYTGMGAAAREAPGDGGEHPGFPSCFRLGALTGLDVLLQRNHVPADPLRILTGEQAARQAEQATKLIVHLVHRMRTGLGFRIRVRPRPFERTADELSRTSFRLHPCRLLDLERLFETAR